MLSTRRRHQDQLPVIELALKHIIRRLRQPCDGEESLRFNGPAHVLMLPPACRTGNRGGLSKKRTYPIPPWRTLGIDPPNLPEMECLIGENPLSGLWAHG
jgi:hypothetical protein